jgi:radical SAM superfamily enzyme YgiQ (UPF0313 family)
MKDIILIQPRAGTFDLLGARIPSGVLSLATLPKDKGYNVKIIDQRIDKDWEKNLIKALKSNPICVGITCMTGRQIEFALKASKIVKEHSTSPVVWGGVHTTILPEESISHPLIDIIVLREGEITFMEVVEALENRTALADVKGIYYKEGGKVKRTGERSFIKNLDGLPDLPYELLDMEKYSSINIEGKSIDFVSSRGCPFNCSFCYNTYFNRRLWRALSAEETVKRLKNMVNKYNIKTIFFQDDNFCADLTRLRKILKGILEEKLDINWGTLGLRVDTAKRMDDSMLQLMEKSGCVNVDIGAESGSKRILEMIDKQITVEDLLSVNKRISKYPFIVKYSFVIGFPTETRDEREATVKTALKLVKDNKRAYTPFFVYTPYPGTPMFDLAIKNGLVPPKSLEEWSKFGWDNWYFNFKSWLTAAQIRELKSIEISSMFYNEVIRYKINKGTTRLLFDLYHPIAKFRFKNYFHKFPVDSLLSRKLLKT